MNKTNNDNSHQYLNTESFPDIVLTLYDFENDMEYNRLIRNLDSLLEYKEPFNILVETIHVRAMKMKYLYSIGKYINSISSNEHLQLKKVTINVYDMLNFNIMSTLFRFIAKPVSHVYIVLYDGGYNYVDGARSIKKTNTFLPISKKNNSNIL